MIPLPDTTQTEVDLSKCVLWAETRTLNYLVYSLEKEMNFEVKVHKIRGNLCIPAAAVWESKYRSSPMNLKNAVILEFDSQEGVDFMTRHNPRFGTSFEGIEEMLLPVPVSHI